MSSRAGDQASTTDVALRAAAASPPGTLGARVSASLRVRASIGGVAGEMLPAASKAATAYWYAVSAFSPVSAYPGS